MRICLIEDNASLRDALALALEDEGFELYAAANGAVGMQFTEIYNPDIVITDMEMPTLNGLGVIRRLRADHPHIRIIAMSGDTTQAQHYLDFAKVRGADRVLLKPFKTEALLEAIAALRNLGRLGSDELKPAQA